jgi:YHS domain-containing protein
MHKMLIHTLFGFGFLLALVYPGWAVAPDEKQLAIENPCTWQAVTCTVTDVKDGGFIVMTSADARQVKAIQAQATVMAQGQKCTDHAMEKNAGGKMMTGCPSAWPHVKTQTENLDQGAKVTWTSADPVQIMKIQEHLKMMAGMKHIATDDLVLCPVTGTKIKKSQAAGSIIYKGKTYYFCCPGCDKEFLKDPEKYIKQAGKNP